MLDHLHRTDDMTYECDGQVCACEELYKISKQTTAIEYNFINTYMYSKSSKISYEQCKMVD